MRPRKRKWLTAGFLLLNLVAHAHVALADDNCHGEGSLFDCSNAPSDWGLQGDWSLTGDSGDEADKGSKGDDGDNQGSGQSDEGGDPAANGQQGDGNNQGGDSHDNQNGDDGGAVGNSGDQANDGHKGNDQGDDEGDHNNDGGNGAGHGNGNTVVVTVNGLQSGAWSLALAPVEDGDVYTYSSGSLSEPSITVAAANKDVWVSFSDGALYGAGQHSPDPALCPLYFWSAPANDPITQPAYYYTSEPGLGGCENRAASTGQVLLPSLGLDSLTRLYAGDAILIPKRQSETLKLTRLAIEVAHLTDLPANQAFGGTLVVTVSG